MSEETRASKPDKDVYTPGVVEEYLGSLEAMAAMLEETVQRSRNFGAADLVSEFYSDGWDATYGAKNNEIHSGDRYQNIANALDYLAKKQVNIAEFRKRFVASLEMIWALLPQFYELANKYYLSSDDEPIQLPDDYDPHKPFPEVLQRETS